jgi:hypothetical protein
MPKYLIPWPISALCQLSYVIHGVWHRDITRAQWTHDQHGDLPLRHWHLIQLQPTCRTGGWAGKHRYRAGCSTHSPPSSQCPYSKQMFSLTIPLLCKFALWCPGPHRTWLRYHCSLYIVQVIAVVHFPLGLWCIQVSHWSPSYLTILVKVILCYDYILTFPAEVRLIWQKPFSSFSLLFYINRYGSICVGIISVLVSFLQSDSVQMCVFPYRMWCLLNGYWLSILDVGLRIELEALFRCYWWSAILASEFCWALLSLLT